MAITFEKRLGSLLIKRGLISEDKNKEVEAIVTKENKSYTEVLVKNKFIDEGTLIATLAQESRHPPVDLEKCASDDNALQVLPEEKARSHRVIPISKIGNILTLAVADPFDILALDELKIITNCRLRFVVSLSHKILEKMTHAYHPEEQQMAQLLEETTEADDLEHVVATGDDIDVAALAAAGADAPIVKFVNSVILNALEEGASDIHIEPFEKHISIRYRKDGVLHEVMAPPKKIFNAVISRIKIMTSLDIAEHRIPQDGKFQIRHENRQIDFRVSTLPTMYGEKVVMRVLDSSSITLGLDALGFEPQALDAFRNAIMSPYGMLLVTGPTGSGKSTTLYSALKEIMSVEDNIMTVEDPVEYQLDGIGQVPINVKRGLTFALALRAILRQDPNKVMVGEIRDSETADIAVKAAMTGHLVLSTLHTNDAASAITRLIDMKIDPFLVATSVILLSAQRLARKLCDQCKQPYEQLPPVEKLLEIGFTEEECKTGQIFHPVGCSFCRDGYRGRFALLETLEIDDEIRKMIIKGKSVFEIKDYSIAQKGMLTLRRCGLLNVLRGKTSIEEVLRMTEK